MESFYGGRQGASFIIKKSFKYIDKQDPAYLADLAIGIEDERTRNPKPVESDYPDDRDAWLSAVEQWEQNTASWANMNLEPYIMYHNLSNTWYKDVWYNEYCIIDTANKNNPNNGKIFRRVLPTEGNSNLPYEEIGTIVGPSSGAAMLKPQFGLIKFGDIRAELEHKWDGLGIPDKVQETNSFGHLVYEDINKNKIYVNANGKFMNGETGEEFQEDDPNRPQVEIKDLTPVFATNEDGTDKKGPVLYDPSFSANSNIVQSQWPDNVELETYEAKINKGLVHGLTEGALIKTLQLNADGEPEFKNDLKESSEDMPEPVVDNIKYNWFNVRKNTESNDGVVESWCYIGFEVPATSFTVEALHSTPGTQPQVYENNISKTHPFWYDLHFEIPGGLRGVSVEEIFISESANAYTFDQLEYDSKSDIYSIKGGQEPFSTKSWFCKLRIMNFNPTPEATTPTTLENTIFYIGPVVEIKHVNLNTETGHLEILYHNKDNDTWDLRYPIDIEMNEITGEITTEYSCAKDGLAKTEKDYFRYPINVEMNPTTGQVVTTYSRETAGVAEIGNNIETVNFRYPIQIDFTTMKDSEYQGLDDSVATPIEYNTGEYFITYSYADGTKDEEKIESDQLGFVRKVVMSEGDNNTKGTITFVNTKSEQNQSYPFSYPKTLSIDTDGKWTIDYYGAEPVSDQFVFPQIIRSMEKNGTVKWQDSAKVDHTLGQINLIDDAFIDENHCLQIAYTKNNEIDRYNALKDAGYVKNITREILDENGNATTTTKEYISFGPLISTPVIQEGLLPITTPDGYDFSDINGILKYYDDAYGSGTVKGEDGVLFVVTTRPSSGIPSDALSYFILWNPYSDVDELGNPIGAWENVAQITSKGGIPAQIGGALVIGDEESWSYEEREEVLTDGAIRFKQLTENEEPLMVSFPWM